jgi:dUTPase
MINVYSRYGDKCLPKRGTSGSIGYDIILPNDITLSDGEYQMVDTGLTIDLNVYDVPNSPNHRMGYLLVPRSSSAKKGLTFANTIGVIDSDYCGVNDIIFVPLKWDSTPEKGIRGLIERFLYLFAGKTKTKTIKAGEAIGQLIFFDSIWAPKIKPVNLDELSSTSRGGFGSTDISSNN